MITTTKQKWTTGASVKVGFMTLVVKAAIATPGDFLPDAYILANQAGTQLYKFVPHNGLEKISTNEARVMMEEARNTAERLAKEAIAKMQSNASAAREIDELFA